jgi:hypothetical protein
MCFDFILLGHGTEGDDSEQVWYCLVFCCFITLALVRPHTTVFFNGLLYEQYFKNISAVFVHVSLVHLN